MKCKAGELLDSTVLLLKARPDHHTKRGENWCLIIPRFRTDPLPNSFYPSPCSSSLDTRLLTHRRICPSWSQITGSWISRDLQRIDLQYTNRLIRTGSEDTDSLFNRPLADDNMGTIISSGYGMAKNL